jgi:RimJ/RimL family protein N-acetyltransferase
MIDPAAIRTLRTERLALEPTVRAHAAESFALRCDASLTRYTGRALPASVQALEHRFSRLETRVSPNGRDVWWNWQLRYAGAIVGDCDATIPIDSDAAFIGYEVFVPYQRRGLAREACAAMIAFLREQPGVRRVVATVESDNPPSWRLLEALGFARTSAKPSPLTQGAEEWRYELGLRA